VSGALSATYLKKIEKSNSLPCPLKTFLFLFYTTSGELFSCTKLQGKTNNPSVDWRTNVPVFSYLFTLFISVCSENYPFLKQFFCLGGFTSKQIENQRRQRECCAATGA
jgi:hypothetical protein